MDTDLHKLAEKIKKCLALAKSSNVHEAAAALRQAQKLMELHELSEEDLAGIGIKDEAVDVPLQASKKSIPPTLSQLVTLIGKAFGVKGIVETRIASTDKAYRVRYFGQQERVATACYAHTVVYRAVEAAWRAHLKENPFVKQVRLAKASFQVGWLCEVVEKIEAIGFSNIEQNALKSALDKKYSGALKTTQSSTNRFYGGLMGEGASAAKSFSLHRPMNGEKQRRIGGS